MIFRRMRRVLFCLGITFLVGFSTIVYKMSTPNIINDSKSVHSVKSRAGDSYQFYTSWEIESEDTDEGSRHDIIANVLNSDNRKQTEHVAVTSNLKLSKNETMEVLPPDTPEKTVDNGTAIHTLSEAIANYKFLHKNRTRNHLDQFVILTTVDSQFNDLMDNWLESLRRLGLEYNITLICEDAKAYRYYSEKQNDHFKVLNTQDYKMLGKLKRRRGTYQQLIRRRTLYVRNLLFSGTDVLLVDIDAVWLKDPLELVRQSYSTYDIWVAQGFQPGVPCPCFLYMKSVPSIMKLAGQWMYRVSNSSARRPSMRRVPESDQFALKHVMKKRRDLKLFSLDKIRFPTGKEFFDPDWNRMNLENVYVAHGNHLGREVNKVDKFKEFGLWLLDD